MSNLQGHKSSMANAAQESQVRAASASHARASSVSRTRVESMSQVPMLQRRTGTDEERRFIRKEKRRVVLNVVLISLAFMVHFTAFQGAGNLQSSVNEDIGPISMAIIYSCFIFFSLFLPAIIIKWLGCKWSMTLMAAYIPYMLAQPYFTYFTMVPSAILIGLTAGTLWCAKCTYLTLLAENYAELSGISSEVLTVRFFGIFFMIFQFCQVWGNLVSSIVFGKSDAPQPEVDVRELCGANFLTAVKNNTNLLRPAMSKMWTVAGIYVCCMVLAVIIISLGVDSLSRYGENERTEMKKLGPGDLLFSTLKLFLEPKLLLMIPFLIWNGVNQAFVAADYTKAYVSCAWGIQYIGYVMISYGVCNSISSLTSGWIVKLTGRLPVVCAAFVVNLVSLVCCLLWKPNPEDKVYFFVFAGIWGACDGVFLVQINAVCGIIFPGREEAAYSNYRIWQSLGSVLQFASSDALITSLKIYNVIGLLCVSLVGYLVVEWLEIKRKRRIIRNDYSVYRRFKI